MPSYPTSSASDPAEQAAIVPKEVRISFWIWVGTAVLMLASVFSLLDDRERVTSQTLEQMGGELSREEAEQVVSMAFTMIFVMYGIVALLFLLFAFKAKAGRNWARIALTVVAALNLMAFLGPNSTHVLSVVSVLVSGVAVALLWMPNSREYFAQAKRRP
ncbi:hypothetical protein TL08_02405 [Actinoalloteichus hymeniacidonis]|uniref:Uncharacterized protein n=1 Tax=Actinoalloteichus hymeniacidonis TaxID=340345 RepID=A0AAC9MWN6_9PSEU|nr:hypothetical protein TL08_02405 [Actinoalloteichus hymeniacidonis]